MGEGGGMNLFKYDNGCILYTCTGDHSLTVSLHKAPIPYKGKNKYDISLKSLPFILFSVSKRKFPRGT
jgi:hypothetical protein